MDKINNRNKTLVPKTKRENGVDTTFLKSINYSKIKDNVRDYKHQSIYQKVNYLDIIIVNSNQNNI